MLRNGSATHSTILRGPTFFSISGSASGILERRLRRARPETVEADVHRQRHLHVDRRRPEPVVLRRRIRLAVREHAEVDALEPEPRAVVELGDRVVDVRPRDDAEADQPIARDRAVLLAEPVVVRAHRRAIDVVVGASCARAAGRPACSETGPPRAGRPCPAPCRRCSGGPTPAVSSTVAPKGCHVSFVRPARRSRNGAGYGGWPSTSSASPPSGSLIVRGAFSRSAAPACAASSARDALPDDRRSRSGAEAWTGCHRRISLPSAVGGRDRTTAPTQRPRPQRRRTRPIVRPEQSSARRDRQGNSHGVCRRVAAPNDA